MGRRLFEYHPVLAYRFIPDLKARVEHESGGYLLRTNAQGFRCCHDFVSPRGAKKRILLFGDSYTAGDGVSDGKRYGDKLEELLGAEVFNFGLSGTGSDQQYLAYKEFAKDIEADLTVIAVLVENIRRCSARFQIFQDEAGHDRYYAKPYFELTEDGLELGGVPVDKEPVEACDMDVEWQRHVNHGGRFTAIRKLVNRVGLKELAQKVTGYEPLPQYDDPMDADWLLLKAILKKFVAEVKQPVVVMPIPLYQYVEGTSDPTSYQSRFREFADETGVILHDPVPDLLKYSVAERRAFRFQEDCHLSPDGHLALATSLAATLRGAL